MIFQLENLNKMVERLVILWFVRAVALVKIIKSPNKNAHARIHLKVWWFILG